MITHALEIAGHFDCADQESQVTCHRLLQGQHRDRLILGLNFQPIQNFVRFDHCDGLVTVALDKRFNRKGDQRLGPLGHVEQSLLEQCELIVKMTVSGGYTPHQPNLPVMNASVRESTGRVKSRSVAASSTSTPSTNRAVRRETRAAWCKLCVTMMMVSSC